MMRLKIGLDWDDVTAPFNSIAIQLANQKYNMNLSLEDITSWENTGRASVVKEFYGNLELYKKQSPSKDTIFWVRKLMDIADVYFISAVSTSFMSIRAEQILKFFPELSPDKIILGSAKNLVHFDIVLDDNIYNLIDNPADYKVLMRKPWNREMTGILSVRDIEEFYCLVTQICSLHKPVDVQRPYIISLVGPSGAGKNELCRKLSWIDDRFVVPRNYTTNPNNQHTYVSEKLWKSMNFFEDTYYGGYRYGTRESDITCILHEGKYPIIPLDMGGAITMKNNYPTKIIYVDKPKKDLVRNLLMKDNLSYDEKVLRIISMDTEKSNRNICDAAWLNNGNVEELSKIIMS